MSAQVVNVLERIAAFAEDARVKENVRREREDWVGAAFWRGKKSAFECAAALLELEGLLP